ncbi:Streptolysin [Dirofilaria immitis]
MSLFANFHYQQSETLIECGRRSETCTDTIPANNVQEVLSTETETVEILDSLMNAAFSESPSCMDRRISEDRPQKLTKHRCPQKIQMKLMTMMATILSGFAFICMAVEWNGELLVAYRAY